MELNAIYTSCTLYTCLVFLSAQMYFSVVYHLRILILRESSLINLFLFFFIMFRTMVFKCFVDGQVHVN